jgi:hypothetical protein
MVPAAQVVAVVHLSLEVLVVMEQSTLVVVVEAALMSPAGLAVVVRA